MVKYNREGDLLFTCAKDNKPNVWWVENGERLGTFNGHQGSVYNCDINFNTTRLLTGSSDRDCKLWDIVRITGAHAAASGGRKRECGSCRALPLVADRVHLCLAPLSPLRCLLVSPASRLPQKTGKELFSWGHKSGVRACQFAHGERMFLSVQDNTFSQTPTIFIYNLAEDLKDRTFGTAGRAVQQEAWRGSCTIAGPIR